LEDSEILQALSSMIKQRRDSIEQFLKGSRNDLVEKETAEIDVIQEFMPNQLSAEEIEMEVDKAITEVVARSVKDMGKVMKVLVPRITGKADGKEVGERVKEKLSSM
ncbi:MAG: GatB/YqeY domain-containing protein, partial [Deltaproteobacteria bacterium]